VTLSKLSHLILEIFLLQTMILLKNYILLFRSRSLLKERTVVIHNPFFFLLEKYRFLFNRGLLLTVDNLV